MFMFFAANRRGTISLEDILKFITASESEPLLGYSVKPSVTFSSGMQSCLPMSSTCTNKLILAIGDIVPECREALFQFFDYAFVK